jgi:hypothetical protein
VGANQSRHEAHGGAGVCGMRACDTNTQGTRAYVEGRSIEPVDLIERWTLCHHLGCVVKYVARIGCRNHVLEQTSLEQQERLEQTCLAQACLEDLKKAAWYLLREINNEQLRVSQTRKHNLPVPNSYSQDTRLNDARAEVACIEGAHAGDALIEDTYREDARTGDSPAKDVRAQNFSFMPAAIAKEWGLSPRLEEVIFYIGTFQKLFYLFPLTRVICLKQALTHLKAEIKAYEDVTSPTLATSLIDEGLKEREG